MLLQVVLPLLVVQSLLVDGTGELTVAEHGTTRQIEIAANLHDHIDLVGLSDGSIEDALLWVVVGIGGIYISHESGVAVGALHVVPSHEVLVGLTNQVERDVLKHGTDDLQMVIFAVGEGLTLHLLLAQAQQELSLFAQTVGSILGFPRGQVVAVQ